MGSIQTQGLSLFCGLAAMACAASSSQPGPPADTSVDDALAEVLPPDVAPPECQWAGPSPEWVGALPPSVSEGGGVDRWESAAYESLKDSVISDEGVHFVATHRQDGDQYRVDGMVDGSAQTLRFERQRLPGGGVDYVLLDGDFDDFFPRRTSQHFGTWEALLADGENPNGVQRMDVGYAADDPRVTFLPPDKQVYPIALERLAALFDAPDAPDAVLGLKPWAGGSAGGTHGGMSLLQSRAALMISGSGARRGVIIDEEAILADVAPTALAALGVPTTGGMGRYGLADDGLYLLRQDGRVLWEGLATDSCDRPKHVIVLLFDGESASRAPHLSWSRGQRGGLSVRRRGGLSVGFRAGSYDGGDGRLGRSAWDRRQRFLSASNRGDVESLQPDQRSGGLGAKPRPHAGLL